MVKTSFPLHDLFRRRSQTGLVLACLTLSVASTLFLLLFSSRVGVGLTSVDENVLTIGLSRVFGQIVRFVTVLVFVVGAVLVSFTVLLMMTQRTRDFGLIKAAGCPNDLLFAYYETELFTVTVVGCMLGVAVGAGADVLSSLLWFQVYNNPPNFWFVPFVFIAFLILALVFGTKPIGDAVKISPLAAISTVHYYGLTSPGVAKPFTKSNLTAKVALRSLYRRKTASLRIVLLLSVVFTLLTVSIGGGIIAEGTSISWVQTASGQNIIAVANENMASQYRSMLSAFAGGVVNQNFNYSSPTLTIPESVIEQLRAVQGVSTVDPRLILKEHLIEKGNFTFAPDSSATLPVGRNRQGDFIVIGVNPANLTTSWHTQGRFLNNWNESNIVVGEWMAQNFFEQPLVQSVMIQQKQLFVVGVCVDPIENGKVAYVPIQVLEGLTGMFSPNLVFLGLTSSADRSQTLTEINRIVSSADLGLEAFSLEETVQDNVDFLGSAWSTIMLLPLFSLGSAALCLVGYVSLAVEEQRQEFGFMRAVGAKPRTVRNIVAIQSIVVLLSSLGFGLSLGTITTLLVLMQHPLVTSFTIAEISVWLFGTLAGMFLLSLIPALRLARTPLLKIMA